MKNYRLTLIRHGITRGNLDGIYMGSGTDEPLCEEGRAKLQALQARFSYPVVDTVFASPLKRAVESAELLFPAAKNKVLLEDLRENSFGEFEGRKISELMRDEAFKKWMDPQEHYTPNGGEKAEDFHKRCSAVLMSMLQYMMQAGVEEAACVTHGGVIMSMLAQRGLPRYTPEHWMADSGCGYLVQSNPELWMRDGIVEIKEIMPKGYLDGQK